MNRRTRNAIKFGEFWNVCISGCVAFSNRNYDFLREFGRWIQFTPSIGAGLVSSLGPHIQRVFAFGAKPQMVWIYTRWVVSVWAIVAHAKAIWNWAAMNNPRGSVYQNELVGSPSSVHLSVPPLHDVPREYPTRFRFVHFAPKAFKEIRGKVLTGEILGSSFDLHSVSLVNCLPRFGLLLQRRGFLFINQHGGIVNA